MDDNSPVQNQGEPETESPKKSTRIFLDDALNAKPAPKKATTSLIDQAAEKKATGPIMGIPTHTAPIPQTIRLKRPSTSPIVISPPDMTTAPTVVKIAQSRSPTSLIGETPTIIKQPAPPRSLQTTSRIILDLDSPATDIRKKTEPIPSVSPIEPTPGPKTIRLKRPSTIMAVDQPEEKPVFPSTAAPEVYQAEGMAPGDVQAAKKSETAKIELPKDVEYPTSATQRKTIKIKRTDRNIIPRTVTIARQTMAEPPGRPEPSRAGGKAEAQPRAKATIQKAEQAPQAPIQDDEPLPVFSILAGLAVICLALLVYLLATQSFGPKLFLPVPSGLF